MIVVAYLYLLVFCFCFTELFLSFYIQNHCHIILDGLIVVF